MATIQRAADTVEKYGVPSNSAAIAGGAVVTLSGAGAPTNGAAGTGFGSANTGAIYFDTTNGDQYINRGSSSSVSWHGVILA